MRHKKIYTIIAVIISAILLLEVFFISKLFFDGLVISLNTQILFQIIICMIGLYGMIIFASSKFINSAVFRFYCCIIIMDFPVNAWSYKITMFSNENIARNPMMYFAMAIELILTISCIIGLVLLTKERRVKLSVVYIGEEATAEFSPAPIGKRLLHYAVDTIMIIYLCYHFIKVLFLYAISARDYLHRGSLPVTETDAQLLAVGIFLLYYLVFETLFVTTPAKCLTNTVIVNSSGDVPGIFQLLGRTLTRFIPFDPLSFFRRSKMGWHDTLTNTYVTDSELRGQRKKIERDPNDLLYVEELDN